MLYLLFFAMVIAFAVALIAVPAVLAAFVPWWGVVLIVVGEIALLRYTLFRVLGFFFGVFVLTVPTDASGALGSVSIGGIAKSSV